MPCFAVIVAAAPLLPAVMVISPLNSVVSEKTYSTRFVESENQTKLQDLVSRAVANLFWSNNTLGTSYSDYFKPESKVYYNDVEIASADSSLYAGSGSLELLLQGSTQPIVVDYVCEFTSNEEFAGVTFTIKGDGANPCLICLSPPVSMSKRVREVSHRRT